MIKKGQKIYQKCRKKKPSFSTCVHPISIEGILFIGHLFQKVKVRFLFSFYTYGLSFSNVVIFRKMNRSHHR